jgi:hypothetical protein
MALDKRQMRTGGRVDLQEGMKNTGKCKYVDKLRSPFLLSLDIIEA